MTVKRHRRTRLAIAQAAADASGLRVLTSANAVLFTPWIEATAQRLEIPSVAVAHAVRQFVDGAPFQTIAKSSGLPLAQVMELYWLPWGSAVSLSPAQEELAQAELSAR